MAEPLNVLSNCLRVLPVGKAHLPHLHSFSVAVARFKFCDLLAERRTAHKRVILFHHDSYFSDVVWKRFVEHVHL